MKSRTEKAVDTAPFSADEARRLIHELRIHQIELEMQNEELRRTQAELEASQARYFELYDQAPVGYLTLNAKGLILEANLTAADFLETPRSVLIKNTLARSIHPEDQDIYYIHRRHVFTSGGSMNCELRMVKSDGTFFWARLDCVVARGSDGAPICRMAMTDITDRKNAEAALQKAHDELERRVAERTAALKLANDELRKKIKEGKQAEAEHEILEAQFFQAQKMEAVGRLAGGVVHDFNNMLNVIKLYAEMALDTLEISNPLHADITEIMTAGQRATELVRQLLAFARKQTISPEIIDLNDALSGMRKMLQRLLGEKIDLIWQPGPSLWKVRTDPTQMNQIVANLIINARDAIAGRGAVTIRTQNATIDKTTPHPRMDLKAGRYVLLTVHDTGCGMDEATLAKIFDPFFTTKGTGKGTGLGLATVYTIVKKNAGLITVDSAPGEGTTFNIFLPRQ